MKYYKGIIIEESLDDNRILNKLILSGCRISNEENPSQRWHLYTVKINVEQIQLIKQHIKQGWYMHCWNDTHMIVVFKDKQFEFNHTISSQWIPAVEYGISIGIPKEQLNFPIE